MVATRYHVEYTQVTIPIIQTSVLPQDTVTDVELNILHLLCLIILRDWDMEIFSNPISVIEHPILNREK